MECVCVLLQEPWQDTVKPAEATNMNKTSRKPFFHFCFSIKKKTLDNPVRKTKITVTCAALSQYLNTIKT